jgi:hypothetical protein
VLRPLDLPMRTPYARAGDRVLAIKRAADARQVALEHGQAELVGRSIASSQRFK